jgi:hypothetical protein
VFYNKNEKMVVKPATKKGSPSKSSVKSVSPSKKKVEKKTEQKRKSRHQFDRVTHQVFTPFFSGLEAHLVTKLVGTKPTSEDIHNAIISYDAKSYFTQAFESKSRRSNKNKNKVKRPLSTFMLFQEATRSKVTAALEKELGRKPGQPEVVVKLGELWNKLKEKPNGIDEFQKKYEENKKLAAAAAAKEADALQDSD